MDVQRDAREKWEWEPHLSEAETKKRLLSLGQDAIFQVCFASSVHIQVTACITGRVSSERLE
jgi:hypothetical protein